MCLRGSFHSKYDKLAWSNDEDAFQRWCKGVTGFPIVDAGMREMNETGFMHNRVRMITASFLVKDLHIDWRRGEKYFAQNLIDYDPAVNNGNWQSAASTGPAMHSPISVFSIPGPNRKSLILNVFISKNGSQNFVIFRLNVSMHGMKRNLRNILFPWLFMRKKQKRLFTLILPQKRKLYDKGVNNGCKWICRKRLILHLLNQGHQVYALCRIKGAKVFPEDNSILITSGEI